MLKSKNWMNNEEIKIFQEYLQIPSVHPDINYDDCVTFLKKQAENLQLPIQIYYPAGPKLPVVVLTWLGTEPNLPSIVLNSHMDVVPVYEQFWTYPPFSATIDDNGRIFARGSQDMKCVGTQYLGAIRALKMDGIQLKRTIHLIYVPEEEIGGIGMKTFVKTQDFTNLNVGFALDEGIAGPTEYFHGFYGERSVWRVHVKCSGAGGHGSLLLKQTAGEKLRFMIDKFMDYRKCEERKLKLNSELNLGDVTTVNLTMINGGIQSNVVPPMLTAVFDVRLAIDVNQNEFEERLNQWCIEAGSNIELHYESKNPRIEPTKIDQTNPFWVAFEKAIRKDLKLKLKMEIFYGRTDSCYIRELGIPAIGFSPMNNTPILLHDHNEYLDADVYLNGIDIYKRILNNIGNIC